MSMNGHHSSVPLGVKNGLGKVPIQPTPGAIRKPPNTKPKQKKSRGGCITCKDKRTKCDETKPHCLRCREKNVICAGYEKNFKWKSFEDIQEQKKNAPVRRKSSVSIPRRREDEENGDGENLEYVLKGPNSVKRQRVMMSPHQRATSHHGSPFTSFQMGRSPSWNDFASPNNGHTNGYNFNTTPRFNDSPASNASNLSPMSINSLLCESRDPIYTPPKTEYISHGAENSFVFDPAPTTIEPPVLHTRTPPPLSGIAPLWQEIEYHPSDESADEDDDPEIEEISRPSEDTDALIPSPKRRRLNSLVSSDAYNLHMLPHDELLMWDFYDKVTCKILSCKNAVGENPWRDDLISRAQQSDPLKHALFAMTRFHMKRYQTDDSWTMATHGLNHTNLSFRALREAMNDGKAFADENNIAAMLVLSFSQVWDDPRLDGRAHVFGASKILEGTLREIARRRKVSTPFIRFLCNTWLYLDVLSSLSSGEDPYYLTLSSSSPSVSPISPASSPLPTEHRSPDGSFNLHNEIDSLLGCAEDLFPLIARMSSISNRLSEKIITQQDVSAVSKAIQVRDELLEWQPPEIYTLQPSSDQHCSLDDVVRTAEVYRLTALLHLYRAFPPLGAITIPALADQILNCLLLIPRDSGSLCIHIWPLMAAGCEHTDPIKRLLVRQRFEDIRERLKVANVDKAIELLVEVWARKDAGDLNAGWASLAREREWHLLLG